MLYRLKEKCGNHRVGKVTYEPGSQIESESDLVKLFPNKFELVTVPVSQAANIAGPTIPIPGQGVEIEEPKSIPAPLSQDDEKTTDVDKDKTPEATTPEELVDYGEDVTKDFKLAEEVGLNVFVKKGRYVVIDPDDNSVLNKKKLKKADVLPFLKTQVEDDDDEEE